MSFLFFRWEKQGGGLRTERVCVLHRDDPGRDGCSLRRHRAPRLTLLPDKSRITKILPNKLRHSAGYLSRDPEAPPTLAQGAMQRPPIDFLKFCPSLGRWWGGKPFLDKFDHACSIAKKVRGDRVGGRSSLLRSFRFCTIFVRFCSLGTPVTFPPPRV